MRIKIEGKLDPVKLKLLNAKFLHDAAPSTMNIDLAIPFDRRYGKSS